MGWSGDAASGHFFIQTPAEGKVFKTKAGGVEVSGTVNAAGFVGDGSGLTNLPATAVTVTTVTGLLDSLNKKADTNWVKGRLAPKADTSWVTTRIANIGTAQIPDGAVTTAKIADSAVTTDKIKNRAITDAKIDSVDWAKVRNKPTIPSGTIADGSVTAPKIAANAVDSTKIANGSICGADINSGASLSIGSLTTSGNVGIGTTNPAGRLEILHNSVPKNATGPQGVVVRQPDNEAGVITFAGMQDPLIGLSAIRSIVHDPSDQASMLMLSSRYYTGAGGYTGEALEWSPDLVVAQGCVGIGTSNVSAARLVVAGNINANGTTYTSDRRYKTSVSPIDSALSKVVRLSGVYYLWDRERYANKNFPEGRQVGLIAQDVEEVIPEVVSTDNEGYKSLAYDKLTALLVEAVKELKAEVDSLKNENRELRAAMGLR